MASSSYDQFLAGIRTALNNAESNSSGALLGITQKVLQFHVSELAKVLVERYGLVVQAGPMAGMKLIDATKGALFIPRLLGCYESELHSTIHRIVNRNYQSIINVGCSEGYYAVGLARLMPSVHVYAFDIDGNACATTTKLAELNDVSDRVTIGGECDPRRLQELAVPGTFVLCDIEGAELDLLDPSRVPGLSHCDMLVECHDFLESGTSQEIAKRFEETHSVTLIPNGGINPNEIPQIQSMRPLFKFVAVWEGRPGPTPWAFLQRRRTCGIPLGTAKAFPTSLSLSMNTYPAADMLRASSQTTERAFVEAVARYGRSSELIGVVADRASREGFQRLADGRVKGEGQRKYRAIDWSQFHDSFFPEPPSRVLHCGGFLDARVAWVRRSNGPSGFALCGVANRALCQPMIQEAIGKLLTAPFEPFDTLVCTSRAVQQFVRDAANGYAEYLTERVGGNPRLLPRIEVIPMGIDPDVYRPATPHERSEQRQAFNILPDEYAVLCAGPLSFHSRANPYPMYHSLYQAARNTNRTIHLLFAGPAANAHIRKAFLDGARVFAPTVKTTVLDSLHSPTWHAADVFALMLDSLTEGLDETILQAMACGLPVVAADWAGCRDLVLDGETGILVPTRLVPDAIPDVTNRLLADEIPLDRFLAQTSQTIVVECGAATQAFTQMLSDEALRRRLGSAGRERVMNHFTWEHIIRTYDQLWYEQETDCVKQSQSTAVPRSRPILYPTLESGFTSYPSKFLGAEDYVRAKPKMETRLHRLLTIAMTQYEPQIRTEDPKLLLEVLRAADESCTIASLDAILRQAGLSYRSGRATLAWLLKYGLLEHPSSG